MLTISPRSDSQPLTLNKNFTVNSKKEAIKNEAIHALLKTASVVAYVATIAIAAAVLTFSFLATGGTTMPLFMIGIALLSIPLCWGAAKLWQMSLPYKQRASIERGVIESTNVLKLDLAKDVSRVDQTKNQEVDFDCDKIRAELRLYGIEHDSETLQEIARQLPRTKGDAPATEEDAIKSLVPVLGRLRFWMVNFYNQHLHAKDLHNTRCKTESTQLEHDRQAYDLTERSVYSSALRASHIFHVLAFPFIQSFRLEDIGFLNVQPVDQRLWNTNYNRPNDYFIFHDKTLQPISIEPVQTIVNALIKTHEALLRAANESHAEESPPKLDKFFREETDQLVELRRQMFAPHPKPVVVKQA